MIKFEPKYVHCFWNDELKGKKGFVANSIGVLKDLVENNDKDWFGEIDENTDIGHISYPFEMKERNGIKNVYQFYYYDPLYEMKVAYEEGKTIQYLSKITDKWVDCTCRPLWNGDSTEYRIKPNKDFHVIYDKSVEGFSVDNVETDINNIFFEGTERNCFEWIKSHKDLEDIIKAYYNDETIQYFEHGMWINWNLNKLPISLVNAKWRIKPIEKKYIPFENTQELIEAWEKKYPTNKDRPNGTMPLIWIKEKGNKDVHLINDFYKTGVGTSSIILSFESLFEEYTFADGSVCGKKEE